MAGRIFGLVLIGTVIIGVACNKSDDKHAGHNKATTAADAKANATETSNALYHQGRSDRRDWSPG